VRENAVDFIRVSGHMKRATNISRQLVYRLTMEDIYCENSHSWERNMCHIRA